MIIELKKFGTTLVSRPAGREAWVAFQPTLQTVSPKEKIEVSFDDVLTFSPAWADEFVGHFPLKAIHEFGEQPIPISRPPLSAID
ncbi:hypothetical protein IID24_05760 [Patescibacteria group bacterium]|nr:hypothetical protein [Patescibacteria group bacterium]